MSASSAPYSVPFALVSKALWLRATDSVVTQSASSVRRRTQKLPEEAGITGERACAQTLRNTYAGLLIEGGRATSS